MRASIQKQKSSSVIFALEDFWLRSFYSDSLGPLAVIVEIEHLDFIAVRFAFSHLLVRETIFLSQCTARLFRLNEIRVDLFPFTFRSSAEHVKARNLCFTRRAPFEDDVAFCVACAFHPVHIHRRCAVLRREGKRTESRQRNG